jgi:hypothetical protein
MDQVDKPQDDVQGTPEGRRRLLRAMAAVGAGAGVPGVALAATRPYCQQGGSNYHASASAVGSMIGSTVGTDTPKWGYRCSHYQTSANWGTTWTCGGRSLTYANCGNPATPNTDPKHKFWVVFGLTQPTAGSATDRYCADILNTYSTSDEAYWLSAVLNACKVGSNFPYTADEVVLLYKSQNPWQANSTQTGLDTKALTLFKNYLSAA